jgi:hypothetical protein
MKTTRSARGPCVLASRTFWKAASQLVYPLGRYLVARYGSKVPAIEAAVTVV